VFFAIGAKLSCFRRSVAERIGQADSVVLIEPPVSAIRHPLAARFRRRHKSPIHGQATNYWPFHVPERIPSLRKHLRRLNQQRLRSEIRYLLAGSPTVVCYDAPTQYDLVGTFQEKLSVYLSIDDRTVTVWGDPIPGELYAERRLLAKVDLVICVSEPLARVLRERSPSPEKPPIHVLTNGYKEWLFNPRGHWPEPDGLRHVSRPRVLVSGHLSERIDWDGVESAASLRPEWTWIFIGPADPGIPEKIHHRLGNRARCYPSVSIEEMPAWIHHCDACAVPYRLNSFTRASSPLKAIEYLAMGKPVLSTRVPSLLQYSKVVEWVEETNGESYASMLDKALARSADVDLALLRSKAVSGDSWNRRTTQFLELVLPHANRPDAYIRRAQERRHS
jgi:glycosyltransferase involved in cell wall biosynthesis